MISVAPRRHRAFRRDAKDSSGRNFFRYELLFGGRLPFLHPRSNSLLLKIWFGVFLNTSSLWRKLAGSFRMACFLKRRSLLLGGRKGSPSCFQSSFLVSSGFFFVRVAFAPEYILF